MGRRTYSSGEGWTWMGCLNKRNNGFYCRAGSNSPTRPWQGAELWVEQPVSEHKVDLADYKLALTETWPLSLSLSPSLSLSLSLVLPLQCVPSFVGWSDKGKGGWQRGGGKRECFLLVLGCFPTMFSLIPLHNSFSWSCPLPFAIHTCEQWILVTAQLARPSRLAPDVHHCAGEVAV